MPRLQDRAEPLRQAVPRHVVGRVEEARVVGAGLLGERLDPGARRERRAGLVEPDVPGAADAEHLQVDAARRGDVALVALPRALGRPAVVARHAHERRVEPERFDDLAGDDGAVALRVPGRQADVLVEGEAAHPPQVERARGSFSDRLPHRKRGGSGGESQHGIRLAGDQARDELGGELAALRRIADEHHLGHQTASGGRHRHPRPPARRRRRRPGSRSARAPPDRAAAARRGTPSSRPSRASTRAHVGRAARRRATRGRRR